MNVVWKWYESGLPIFQYINHTYFIHSQLSINRHAYFLIFESYLFQPQPNKYETGVKQVCSRHCTIYGVGSYDLMYSSLFIILHVGIGPALSSPSNVAVVANSGKFQFWPPEILVSLPTFWQVTITASRLITSKPNLTQIAQLIPHISLRLLVIVLI